ncbi:MAG: hypothetical protein A2295_01330 [Candidatus Jacksonbacteria bacterium RIFOXYB2_FULL_44_15]|nr:MAG: hypothetical protein UV19_C0003G0004 [Parcubacteria group bacterium GW2011_GWA2_42_28]KKT55823.1 MAG: hypothetical protein UW45_C0004G0004 [Parcubacteria group bacterium GW2011_GWC2_44_22]OGY75603.1 MAG: hypothetical protein A2240_03590 [Candidatus Jacksonbacteria bacterium RIFOXYA2_FULL_43_12]OGY76577.1 MAG: hypothetical protein A2295_01330 [Candidatus Jacksonbacteria bacterium RIFOXYB2_FULL_44_15]OGY81505.1 MAG: hypothetical protein A2550_00685 [Candidatus Jacksonbacteria bacterium RI
MPRKTKNSQAESTEQSENIEPDKKPRRLCRSTSDRMIAGVCGGLAEYFNIDPTIVRLIFVATVLFGGSGIIAYVILWAAVPEKQ